VEIPVETAAWLAKISRYDRALLQFAHRFSNPAKSG
jgi:hypothetical protein